MNERIEQTIIDGIIRDICELNYDPLPGQHEDEVRITLAELRAILEGYLVVKS